MSGRSEVEHLAEVGSGFAEEGGDDAVRANDGEGPAELAGDDLGRQGLAAAGWSAEQNPIARTQPVGPQHFLAIVLAENFLDQRQVVARQHDILDPADGFAQGQQRNAPLTVLGDALDQAAQRRRGWCAGPSVQDGLKVVCEKVMLLLPLVGDDLFRHTAEGVQVSFRTGANELSQQLAVCHDPLTSRSCYSVNSADDYRKAGGHSRCTLNHRKENYSSHL